MDWYKKSQTEENSLMQHLINNAEQISEHPINKYSNIGRIETQYTLTPEQFDNFREELNNKIEASNVEIEQYIYDLLVDSNICREILDEYYSPMDSEIIHCDIDVDRDLISISIEYTAQRGGFF